MKKLCLFVALMFVAFACIAIVISKNPELARYMASLMEENMFQDIIIAASGIIACAIYTLYDVVYNVMCDIFKSIVYTVNKIFTKRTA